MVEEVLQLVESGNIRRAKDMELILRLCLTHETKDRVLRLAGEFLEDYGLGDDMSYLLMECAYMDKVTADRVHEMIKPYQDEDKYDQALLGCIPYGYANEAMERAMLNPNYYTDSNIPYAIEVDSSLAARALDYVKANITKDNKYDYFFILEACAVAGFHVEVLAIMNEFPSRTLYFEVLKLCFERGLEREVEDYITQHIPAPEDKSEKFLKGEKIIFIEEVTNNLQNTTFESDEVFPILSGLRLLIDDLTFAEFQFLRLVVAKYGLMHPHTVEFISNEVHRAEIFKTGSTLSLLSGEFTGIFVNQIPDGAAQIWRSLAEETDDPIPVAPIIKFGKVKGDIRTVYSRYCGLSFDAFMRRLELDTSGGDIVARLFRSSPQYLTPFQDVDFLYSFRDPLVKDVVEQVNQIVRKLDSKGISHGHLHIGNIVIELIDQEYVRSHLNTDQSDTQKPTINNIPFREDKFTFDSLRYDETDEQGNRKWRVVVRLIDFDLASFLSTT